MILSPASSLPFAFWPSAVAIVAYLLGSGLPSRPHSDHPVASTPLPDRRIWALLALGWLTQGVAIVLDTLIIDGQLSGARFGFAPALSVTSWLVIAVYALESHRLELPSVRRLLTLLAAITVGLAWIYPGRPYPLVNQSNWLPLHWLLGFASYGLFGAALLHAALLRHAERQMRANSGASGQIPAPVRGQALGMPLLRLERLTLKFVSAGFVMLTLTLALGFWLTTPWHWDHKSVFSVLAWGVFATLLVGRARFGWRGRQAVGWLIAGSTLLLLGYVGSRFVLEVILQRGTH